MREKAPTPTAPQGQRGQPLMNLQDFMAAPSTAGGGGGGDAGAAVEPAEAVPYLDLDLLKGDGRTVYFETYGCQVGGLVGWLVGWLVD
jgi:hypothetical protein